MSTIIPVGINTHSVFNDFYVYEWVIRETGEVFYVGKGRGERAYEYHYNNENAEKIRATNEIDIIIIRQGLSEEEALCLETEEIIRIKEETPWILTNVSTPQGYANAWSPSKSTPKYVFEKSPIIYTSDVEEHYFGLQGREYDKVELSELKSVYIVEKMLWPEIQETVFGGRYEKYYEEMIQYLKEHGVKVLTSQYAKSVSAWIYCGNLSYWLYEDEQRKAEERVGHRIPTIHLVDVWKELKNKYGNCLNNSEEKIEVKAVNNRIPLSDIPQFTDDMIALKIGSDMVQKGLEFYCQGEYITAINFFDKARSMGSIDPTMYHYYAVMYRKLKDYNNEVDILDEAMIRYQIYNQDVWGSNVRDFKRRREKAFELLKKEIHRK